MIRKKFLHGMLKATQLDLRHILRRLNELEEKLKKLEEGQHHD